jgi:SAM-dependent methyltransferase
LETLEGEGLMSLYEVQRLIHKLNVEPGQVERFRNAPDELLAEYALEDAERTALLEGDAAALPLADAAFDVVLCQQGLQFFPDRLAALREMRRVLRSGGPALLSVWKGANVYHTAVTEALSRHVGADVAARTAASRVVPDAGELRELVLSAGFRDVAIEACRMDIRLPAVDRFVLSHLAATPVAAAVATAGADRRRAVADHVRLALQAYADGDGVRVPDESNVVTALV